MFCVNIVPRLKRACTHGTPGLRGLQFERTPSWKIVPPPERVLGPVVPQLTFSHLAARGFIISGWGEMEGIARLYKAPNMGDIYAFFYYLSYF